ncbi:enoyl-CoA hydratase-related protein [Gemmobacter sp.]|uniref:enoyl-CoA hydratase-related protein n=1 Tax=Gemmobacter sp. TaxID=1898957 RepID=UPI002B002CD7|nr:enoyl-CoA hydratase-related protein [Gemmobacter sp.]
MDYQAIRYEMSEGLALITLDRPEVMNALNARLCAELAHALRRAGAEARAVVLTGAGRAFCSGQDLSEAAQAEVFDAEKGLRETYDPMMQALMDCTVPVIAAVNGPAAGAGASIALTADVVVATESAYFLQAFSRIGLIPDAGGTWWLPRQIGMPRAMGMALFADRISARQAADWGLIWEAVADEAFAGVWQARARYLADGPTQAFRRAKAALRAAGANDHAGQLALEARLQGECARTEDFREGVAAFLQKRPARFQGR